MTNSHIIVGEPRRCICGNYDGHTIGCSDFLASLAELVRMAKINGSGVHLYAADIFKIDRVIQTLLVDCTQPEQKEGGG